MRSKRILATALGASLLLGATACGDDDDEAATTTSTTEADGPTAIEVTLTSDGFEGMPDELPAGLVEITLVNDSGGYGSLDITRVTEGTAEDEFVDALAALFDGGEFPDFFEANVGVAAEEGETETATVILREGEHIAWYETGPDEGEEGPEETEETETETETETATETETEDADTSTTVAGDDGAETTTSTTAAEETTTTVAGDEGAAGTGQPVGTLTAVAVEDESETEEGVDDAAEEDEPLAEEPESGQDEGGEDEGSTEIITAALTVTAGDAAAELPEADGEVVVRDYEFEVTFDGPGTINFRNEGPQQFHHAVVIDFGTNDPADVEEAFPAILESEGDPSALTDVGDVDMEQVDFDFAGSGVFGPEDAGTFEADIEAGNTYALVCFIQDRTGGPPHAIAYDMWEIVQAGGGDASTTTEG